MSRPYQLTLADLRNACPLLANIEVIGGSPSVAGCQYVKGNEQLIGRNAAGTIVVRSKPGKVTPEKVKQFRNDYQIAVAAGIIKRFTPAGQERNG